MFDAIKIKNECVQWIRDWFDKNGKDCKAVIGISGGKDSTVAAALCVEALGHSRVFGVMMPNGVQNDLDDAIAVCDYLNIDSMIVNIKPAVDAIIKNVFNTNIYSPVTETYNSIIQNISEQTKINLPPRVRMTTLYAISQSINGRVVNTCNLSEDYVGYSTRWGDSVGDFAPLANLTSEEVVVIGDVCGIPYELTHKVPSDGLCGKTDEDNLGFSYVILNKYIRTGICEDNEIKNRIDKLHKKNLFKLQPIPTFVP